MGDDEAPEDRCGFVLEPGDVPEHAQDANLPPGLGIIGKQIREHDAGSDEWYERTKAVCCWREVWEGADDGRCIWHAESDDKPADALMGARADGPERLDGAYVPAVELGDTIDFERCRLWGATFDGTDLQKASFAEVGGRFAQFPDADLGGAQFPDASLCDVQFPDADFRYAQFPDAYLRDVQFPDANLWAAQFHDANLRDVQFPDADLEYAQLPDADLEAVQFPDADLEDAQFPGAHLRDVQFPDADLWGATFEDAYMSLEAFEEDRANFDGTTVFGWSDHELHEHWDRAARTYRAFQQTLSEHAMPGEVRRYRIREMHMRRKAAFPGNPVEWAKLALARWTTEYGENPWRVAATAVAVIVGCALVYPFIGGVIEPTVPAENSTTHELQRVVSVNLGLPEWGTEILVSLYFSVVTFTTLGYGDLRPATAEAQALATFESFIGALLMALLVYVLGRRATW